MRDWGIARWNGSFFTGLNPVTIPPTRLAPGHLPLHKGGFLGCADFCPVLFCFSLSQEYGKSLNPTARTRRERCPQRSAAQIEGSRNAPEEDEFGNPLQI